MSVALIRDGVIRPSENDSHVLTAMLPSSCPQNHAANILPLPDGALMCVWFAGTQGRYCRYFCLGIAIARWRNAVERCGQTFPR